MVNTFLVDSNVYLSARYLDNLRLNKQIVEGITIYRIINNLKLLGNHYNNNKNNNYELYDWIRQIVKLYKNENCIFVFKKDGTLIKHPKGTKLVQQSYNQDIISDSNDVIHLKSGNKLSYVDKKLFVGLEDNWIKLGYIYHPAILTWFNYIEGLKHYINVHIQEHKSRGFNTSVNIHSKYYEDEKTQKVDVSSFYPPCITDNDYLMRHRSNLSRKMPEHYSKLFPGINDKLKYFWPFTNKVSSKNGIADNSKRYLKSNNIIQN